MIALERWSEPWRRLAAAPPAGLLDDLANRDEVELREAAERIRRTLAGQAIDAVSRPIQVTIGGAVYPQAGADGDALFKAANDALRFAKNKGKNQAEIAGLDDGSPAD